jgi:hypothetical protein
MQSKMKLGRAGRSLTALVSAMFSLMTAGAAHADPVPIVTKGVLTLQLGALDRFVWGPTGEAQPLSSTRCALTTGANLMSVTGTGSTPGFNSDSIGLAGSASSGIPCGRVSAGEGGLRFALGTSLAGLIVTKGSFDVETKKNAVIQATTYDHVGGGPTQTFYLVTGTSKTKPMYSGLPNADLTCSSASDSGPDSGAADNCRWNITGQWTKIEFTALVGEFGMEGGADGTGATTFTVGQIGDGFLGCPASPESNQIPGPDPVPGQPTISGARLTNVDDPQIPGPAPACVAVPYDITTTCPAGVTGACTNFEYNPLDQGTNMTFTFHWEWPPEAIPATGINGVQPTLQFFVNGNPIGVELDFCPEIVPVYTTDGVLTGIDPAHPVIDQDGATGTQAGCLISRQVKQLDEPNLIQVIEDAYVQGDYAARRN